MLALGTYFERFSDGDPTVPSDLALKPLAKALDEAAKGVVNDFVDVLRTSPQHQARVRLLQAQPRTCGNYSEDKELLGKASSFEQMVAVCDWLAGAHIRQCHTFFLSRLEDDYFLVQATKFKGIDATPMHILLGAKNGSHKAPRYRELASSDPREDDTRNLISRKFCN